MDDFSVHRNTSMEKATGQWLLVIDADEEIVDTDKEETRRVLEADKVPSVLLVQERLVYPHGRTVTMLVPRLVRASKGYPFIHPVHEQLSLDDEPQMLSNVTLVHHGYATEAATEGKEERNLRLALKMPDDNPHALHCRSRAGLSLRRFGDVVTWCRALVEHKEYPYLALEGTVLGAVAAYHLGDHESFRVFVELGDSLAPQSPDVRLLAVLKAMKAYEEAIGGKDSSHDGAFYRPWMFWHSLNRVKYAFGMLVGQQDDWIVEINRRERNEHN